VVDSINFVTSATYAPPGGLQSFTDGAAINGAAAYNSRLQPLQLFYGTNAPPAITSMTTACPSTVGNIMNKTFGFGFGATDNGNVLSITNCRNTSRNETLAYDVLNRIASAQSGGTLWGETFSIDTWGNLTGEGQITGKTNHENLSTTADTNNRLVGFGYDPAGNMTTNTALGATYVYDDENRLIWTSGDRYVYDGDGKRVEKCVAATSTTACPTSGTNGTLYWRGTGSDTQDETDLSGNPVEQYIFFNGARIARRDVTSAGATIAIHYYFSDQVGSHSVVTNAAGTATEQDIDYYPYGGVENDYCTACVAQHYKFTGKERDTESGLDNFGARYDTSSLGRFMTPDWAAKPVSVPYANFGNPQSLNLYSYVENNPTTLGDPDGHVPWSWGGGGDCPGDAEQCQQNKQQQWAAQSAAQATPQQAQNQQSPQRGLTVGVGLAGNADVGVVKAGAEANATVVATASISSSGKPSVGVAASGAAVAYAGDHVAAAPKQETKPLVAGAYAGGGVTLVVANTANSKGLSGPFQTISGNVGGGQGASVALSFDHNGTFVFQVTLGPGLGVSGWAVTTNTKAGCAGGSACE
jgi:RHS repeat-associated protein